MTENDRIALAMGDIVAEIRDYLNNRYYEIDERLDELDGRQERVPREQRLKNYLDHLIKMYKVENYFAEVEELKENARL